MSVYVICLVSIIILNLRLKLKLELKSIVKKSIRNLLVDLVIIYSWLFVFMNLSFIEVLAIQVSSHRFSRLILAIRRIRRLYVLIVGCCKEFFLVFKLFIRIKQNFIQFSFLATKLSSYWWLLILISNIPNTLLVSNKVIQKFMHINILIRRAVFLHILVFLIQILLLQVADLFLEYQWLDPYQGIFRCIEASHHSVLLFCTLIYIFTSSICIETIYWNKRFFVSFHHWSNWVIFIS